MDANSRIFVAGHRGLVGSALVRRLRADGFRQILTRERSEVDLTRQDQVERFFDEQRPEYVFLAAARVGGIRANQIYSADFIRDNLLVQTLTIEAARRSGASKLLFLGSSCIYPKLAPQPILEDALLSGPLEPTNQAYAIAKIAGIETIQSYRRQHGFNGISLMPTNLYGPGDNFDLETAHVLPALIRKFHEAKREQAAEVKVWGSGRPRREFLHVDDLADSAVFLMRGYDSPEIINVGCGQDHTIADLAEIVRHAVGYEGSIVFDPSMPDGTPRKLLDVSRLKALGWYPRIPLHQGIEDLCTWYERNADTIRTVANT